MYVCLSPSTWHVLRAVTRMAASSWEEESWKCGGGRAGSSSQQEPGRGWICDVLETPSEIQKDSFQIWNGTSWSQGSLMFGIGWRH